MTPHRRGSLPVRTTTDGSSRRHTGELFTYHATVRDNPAAACPRVAVPRASAEANMHDVWSVNTDFEYHEKQRVVPEVAADTGVQPLAVAS